MPIHRHLSGDEEEAHNDERGVSAPVGRSRLTDMRSGLPLDPIDCLNELRSGVRCWVCQDDDAKTVTLAPQDIGTIRDVGLCRGKQCFVERLLAYPALNHARLRMAGYGNIAEPHNVAVKVRTGFFGFRHVLNSVARSILKTLDVLTTIMWQVTLVAVCGSGTAQELPTAEVDPASIGVLSTG